jgi:phospholipid N-methyltransferase
MPRLTRLRPQPDHRLRFFQGFLSRPKEVGSIIPSSRFLERRVIRCGGIAQARLVVELGPGTGGTTRALLRAMRPDATLVAIEINPRFAEVLRNVGDPRLRVHEGSAADLSRVLGDLGLPAPDVVVSGIPFSTMTRDVGTEILRAVHDALRPGGRFVAYQVRDRVAHLGRQVFGRAAVQLEPLNVPPMRVYRWVKADDDAAADRPALRA